MSRGRSSKTTQYAVALAFGIFGGIAIWYWGSPTSRFFDAPSDSRSDVPAGGGTRASSLSPLVSAYISGVQHGRCNVVIDRVWWMEERLSHARRTGGEEAVESERDRLCTGLTDRSAEGNLLSNEGIEDQYLFAPGTETTLLRKDAGRTDLAKAVADRHWIRVSFPAGFRAPRDREGRPIRSMVVGLNVSHDGYILKAGVRGNVDIDWERIELHET